MDPRTRARELAAESLARGDPTGWFEQLYQEAETRGSPIPWADLRPNPNMVELWSTRPLPAAGRSAIVVGAGLGDDAEWLSGLGFSTTAFDIAPSAVRACRRRFPRSRVEYAVADLLHPPEAWDHNFDLGLESYTLQVLPASVRRAAIERIAGLIAPAGKLLVFGRVRAPEEPEGSLPWPLLRQEVLQLEEFGMRTRWFEEFLDGEHPPVRRFRALFDRPSG